MQLLWLLPFQAVACGLFPSAPPNEPPIVIAHRGASGYLPEHTLPAKALAHGMGADYIEQDVVMTRDDQLIVLHDIQLDTVTNVAQAFPQRAREDGRFYAIDFTLAEIKQLRVHERIRRQDGKPVYPARFPARHAIFRVPTLDEEIQMIQGLNGSRGGTVGIYVEMKRPGWHRAAGKDLPAKLWQTLAGHGYRNRQSGCFVQCFDPAALRRLRHELRCPLRLVQLIGQNDGDEAECDYDAMRSREGLAAIALYADGIGPKIDHIVAGFTEDGKARLTGLVGAAHAQGMFVHPYTLRVEGLPAGTSFEQVTALLFAQAGVDGIFTDFPDRAIRARQQLLARRKR